MLGLIKKSSGALSLEVHVSEINYTDKEFGGYWFFPEELVNVV